MHGSMGGGRNQASRAQSAARPGRLSPTRPTSAGARHHCSRVALVASKAGRADRGQRDIRVNVGPGAVSHVTGTTQAKATPARKQSVLAGHRSPCVREAPAPRPRGSVPHGGSKVCACCLLDVLADVDVASGNYEVRRRGSGNVRGVAVLEHAEVDLVRTSAQGLATDLEVPVNRRVP
jgi:hypothetical protein